ncbi:Tumor necrosis factor receptor superfamily member 11B [Channa argus]|uniref:Tumor necrosis factor receptor superfamily member 11B n=2 Tax=Channa argus TaxID=215402 RepID=A0A6G1PNI9_CHAAH|nr:Tumor necrosis factor receptor superfamily member 11B [Channa argus]
MDSVPTYKYTNPISRETLICDKCPPGTHWTAHCTGTTPTQCAPCKSDQFTALWNYLPRCLYCSTFCTENQEVETECSPVNDRVCRCKEGFYWAEDFCARHSECGPGHGVELRGTSHTNTVCHRCAEGYFSNSSSALETCVKHQECPSGQIALLQGSVYGDTLCGSCEDLAKDGEALRTFLSGFFSVHRMRVGKMRKFVTRHIHKSVRKERDLLRNEISAWLALASVEQLGKLPQMLETSQLDSMAHKLDKRLRWIEQQSPNCVLNL